MALFLVVQNTYDNVEIALYDGVQSLETKVESKLQASKNLVLHINKLLTDNKLIINDIDCIIANQGPGPFTTLRVVITTVNGLAYATLIPLIGINSLHALLAEHTNPMYPITVALLNAFGKDVYYSIEKDGKIIEFASANSNDLIEKIQEQFPDRIVRFIGNGAALYKTTIQAVFENNAFIPDPVPGTATIAQIAKMGIEKYHNKQELQKQLLPIYLKDIKPK